MVWGSSKVGDPEETTDPPKAQDARIISMSDGFIAAIEAHSRSAWVYTFYPTVGVGFFSNHVWAPVLDNASARTYFSKCSFGTSATR